jgi:hypothetical protein
MVEFALIAPLFFVLLFSLIEFGRMVYYIQMLNNAAREGARYAIVHGKDSSCPSGPIQPTPPCDTTGANVVKAVKDYAIAVIDPGAADFAVTIKWCNTADCPGSQGDGTNSRGQTVAVEVAYNYKPLIGSVFSDWSGAVPLPTFHLTGGSSLVINH